MGNLYSCSLAEQPKTLNSLSVLYLTEVHRSTLFSIDDIQMLRCTLHIQRSADLFIVLDGVPASLLCRESVNMQQMSNEGKSWESKVILKMYFESVRGRKTALKYSLGLGCIFLSPSNLLHQLCVSSNSLV